MRISFGRLWAVSRYRVTNVSYYDKNQNILIRVNEQMDDFGHFFRVDREKMETAEAGLSGSIFYKRHKVPLI